MDNENSSRKNGFLYGMVGVLVALVVFAGGYYFCSSQKAAPVEAPAIVEEGAAENAPDGQADVPADAPSGVVYYYGKECPHCHDVLEFIEENDITSKVEFEKKETWHDEGNNAELVERAAICGYAPNQIGVPFLYADGECFIGTPNVTGYLSEQAGITDAAVGE